MQISKCDALRVVRKYFVNCSNVRLPYPLHWKAKLERGTLNNPSRSAYN